MVNIYENIDNKKIQIFYNEEYKNNRKEKVPVILLNTYSDEGNKVWEECKRLNTNEFILVAISNLNWNDDMTPWECKPLFKGDNPYNGYADLYIEILKNNIISKVDSFIRNELQIEIENFGIAGYSLAGLFALYSGYKLDIFKKIATVSGSLWYPNLIEYVQDNDISKNIDKIYFSLGNKEKNSKIELLKKVEDNTKYIYEYINNNYGNNSNGNCIKTIYEENEGNHFQDSILRTAKGIKWILE